MDTEANAVMEVETAAAADETMDEPTPESRQFMHSIMDVLLPATPPKPVNPRVIRRLGI